MKVLCDLFIPLGLKNVSSFKASGNILFETENKKSGNTKTEAISVLEKKKPVMKIQKLM